MSMVWKDERDPELVEQAEKNVRERKGAATSSNPKFAEEYFKQGVFMEYHRLDYVRRGLDNNGELPESFYAVGLRTY